MVKDELRKLLNQPYKSENWKKVTEFVFPNVSYLQTPQEIPFETEEVESFTQIGNVKLSDGKNLAMFEVHVAANVNLASNRVKLRKLVAPLIDQERNHGVLVVYEQGKDDYRFTFTAKSTEFDEEVGDFKNIETDAKRFTYILGKNESCKTAANRFWELSNNKEKATIKDVEHAFSVERLNKEFFEKYKCFYEDFVQHITGKRFEKEKGKWVEKTKGKPIPEHKVVFGSNDKLARNFVKLLLGRLVFIQFLQKKGWMGVPANSENWKNGQKDFLFQLFNSSRDKSKFHSDVLFELFYRAFNTPDRPNDIFELTGSRVPYLNGGLFENEYSRTELINFPESYFQNLIDFFGQYNFTIDENDPLDHEVGIDPEMLGHIFENLLEDNKDKGAFYTPKPIVQYMCQESLIQYLKTYLFEKNEWPVDLKESNDLEDGLQNFVRKKVASSIIDFDEQIAIALRDVKICDPAIGSGAFPMGLLNEIFYCIQVLHNASPDVVGQVWNMQTWQADIVKKNIIQHSIYGVDLDKGAVDIARLRFWLSLIVDENEPYPLPNLDFKIIQGNSLLESYEGIDLSKISGKKTSVTEIELDLFGNPKNVQTSIFNTSLIDDSNITELIESYFNAQIPARKQELKQQIESIIHQHIDYNLEFEENKLLILITDLEFKLNGNTVAKTDSNGIREKKEKTRAKITLEINKTKDRLKNLQLKRKELHAFQNKSEKPYFLWQLFFKDVFDSGGFDIVIGNPPYVQLQKMGKDCTDLEKVGYKTFERTGDIYCLFYELGCEILKPDGVLTYITSNKWMRSAYGESLRKYFIDRTNPLTLIDFSGYQVFETATVDTNILILKKSLYSNTTNTCILGKGFSIKNMSDYFRQNGRIASFEAERSWVVLSSIEEGIRAKIEQTGTALKDWDISINYGIKTGYNEAFIIDGKTREELIEKSPNSAEIIRPIIRGRDTLKYFSEWKGFYLITTFPSLNLDIEEFPAIKKHLLSFGKERLEQTGKQHIINKEKIISRKKTGNKWFETQDQIGYWEQFDKPKIVWKRIGSVLRFAYDETNALCLDSTCFATGTDVKYLTGVLNSTICIKELLDNSPKTGTGDVITSVQALEPIRVPKATENQRNKIAALVDNCIQILSKNEDADISSFEKEIDDFVLNLYGLNEEEKTFILNSVKPG